MLQRWLMLDIFVVFFCSVSQSKELKGPPRLYSANRLVTAIKGDQVKLPCPISANPEPLYEWEKDGRPVDNTWPRYGLRRHFLRIKAARESDTGEFTCTGVNGFGQQTFTYSLLVYDEDLPAEDHQIAAFLSEVSPMSPSRLEIGQSVALMCRAKGNPPPKITWSKDGQPLHRNGIKLDVRLNSINDQGRYVCSVANPLSIVTHEFSVVLADETHDKYDVPSNTTIIEGENATLHCMVDSNRPPDMQWLKLISEVELRSSPRLNKTVLYRDGRPYRFILTSKSHRFENGTSMSQLKIGRATLYDDGSYICVATTNQGYNYKEVHLTVLPATDNKRMRVESSEGSEFPWLFIIIPICLVLIVTVSIVVLCRAKRTSSEKTYPAGGTKNVSMEPEEPDTPIHCHKVVQTKAAFVPDLIFQDGSSYSTNVTNMCPGNGSLRAIDTYQENPYLDPNYADPFVGRFDPSDHNYAFLTQSSTSPLPPPPYAFPPRTYVYAPPSPAPKFVVHCNL